MSVTIIGIDCAVDAKKVGIAVGSFSSVNCRLLPLPDLGKAQSVEKIICNSIEQSAQTLLALDAPLGWPDALGKALSDHSAGSKIAFPADLLFRRATDRFVKKKFNKQPLDVGADRIARTAKAALGLLERIRSLTGLAIPLAWEPFYTEKAAAIEVYPAGTLIAHGLPSIGYKKKDQKDARKKILDGLRHCMSIEIDLSKAEGNADVLDGIVCVLSGFDFLTGRAFPPDHSIEAQKEGWIWVKGV